MRGKEGRDVAVFVACRYEVHAVADSHGPGSSSKVIQAKQLGLHRYSEADTDYQ